MATKPLSVTEALDQSRRDLAARERATAILETAAAAEGRLAALDHQVTETAAKLAALQAEVERTAGQAGAQQQALDDVFRHHAERLAEAKTAIDGLEAQYAKRDRAATAALERDLAQIKVAREQALATLDQTIVERRQTLASVEARLAELRATLGG